jgi:hypothetical protein
MTTRKYSSRAQQTTLSSTITSGDTTMTVGNGPNLMGGKTPAVVKHIQLSLTLIQPLKKF